jgi:hypothetical protein
MSRGLYIWVFTIAKPAALKRLAAIHIESIIPLRKSSIAK